LTMANIVKETRLSAYLIVHITDVIDSDAYARYRADVPATLHRAGGRYLVRGGATTVLEGDWHPSRLVVVEFANAAAARTWWESTDYAALKQLRQRSVHTEMVLVEGVTEKESL
jgi:uncharacterized protein (DUF1330 family)